MAIYKVQLIKNNQKINLGANDNVCYDNYLYWQLGEIVKACKENKESELSDLARAIEKKARWFKKVGLENDAEIIIDLDKGTITKPYFPIYNFDEVNKKECCIDLVIRGNKYFAKYEDGEEYEMIMVNFNHIDLLKSNNELISLDEFLLISEFVNSIIKTDETDFVVNNQYVIRFNNA